MEYILLIVEDSYGIYSYKYQFNGEFLTISRPLIENRVDEIMHFDHININSTSLNRVYFDVKNRAKIQPFMPSLFTKEFFMDAAVDFFENNAEIYFLE